MVRVNSLNKIFYDDAGPIHVLRNADLTINKGEMVALVGRSGAGKTTLLQILGGIDSYTSGNVFINGREISSMNPYELSQFRGKYIGFVFQFHHLLPDFSALENIFIPGLIIRRKKRSLIGRAKELLSIMGLENRFSHFPAELSGGERQRVALARALFNEPALILADEPTGNLDTENSAQLMKLIKNANTDLHQTFLIATHNEYFSEKMNRKIFIEDGKIYSNNNK